MTDNKLTTGRRPNGKWASPEVKQRFLDLIHEGVSIRGASRLVGINRRTGQEWVNGRNELIGTTAPGRKAVQPLVGTRRESLPHPRREEWVGRRRRISDRYRSEEERIRIADLRREKRSVRSIAAELGRSPSTISREIRWNCNPNLRPSHTGYYRPFAAQKRAGERR